MKRIFAALLALLMLAGCTVGPKEELEAPVDQQTITAPAVTDEPTDVDVSEDEIVPPAEPDVDVAPPEPEVEDVPTPTEPEPDYVEAPEETEPVITPESDYEIEYYEEPLTVYSTISLNVRSGPSTDYERIGTLREGQAAVAIGEADGWYFIEFKDDYGFVSGSYMTDEDPNQVEEIDYPELSLPELSVINTIVNDFAADSSVSPESVSFSYFGEYDAGEVVLMLSTELAYTADIYEFDVAGYDFELGSGTYRIELHTEEGKFVDIKDAYERGLLSKNDIAAIHHYRNNSLRYVHAAESGVSDNEIINAYLKSLPENTGITYDQCYIINRYGYTSNGPVVLMECTALAYTEALTSVNVGPVTFHFRNGNNRISLYYNGELIFLPDAYEQGLVTDDELRALIANDFSVPIYDNTQVQ